MMGIKAIMFNGDRQSFTLSLTAFCGTPGSFSGILFLQESNCRDASIPTPASLGVKQLEVRFVSADTRYKATWVLNVSARCQTLQAHVSPGVRHLLAK